MDKWTVTWSSSRKGCPTEGDTKAYTAEVEIANHIPENNQDIRCRKEADLGL